MERTWGACPGGVGLRSGFKARRGPSPQGWPAHNCLVLLCACAAGLLEEHSGDGQSENAGLLDTALASKHCCIPIPVRGILLASVRMRGILLASPECGAGLDALPPCVGAGVRWFVGAVAEPSAAARGGGAGPLRTRPSRGRVPAHGGASGPSAREQQLAHALQDRARHHRGQCAPSSLGNIPGLTGGSAPGQSNSRLLASPVLGHHQGQPRAAATSPPLPGEDRGKHCPWPGRDSLGVGQLMCLCVVPSVPVRGSLCACACSPGVVQLILDFQQQEMEYVMANPAEVGLEHLCAMASPPPPPLAPVILATHCNLQAQGKGSDACGGQAVVGAFADLALAVGLAGNGCVRWPWPWPWGWQVNNNVRCHGEAVELGNLIVEHLEPKHAEEVGGPVPGAAPMTRLPSRTPASTPLHLPALLAGSWCSADALSWHCSAFHSWLA